MKELFTVVKKGMTKLLAAIATLLLSIMTLLVLYQVFTRYVLNSPAAFTEELVRYFLIWTGFTLTVIFSPCQNASFVSNTQFSKTAFLIYWKEYFPVK